MASICPLSVEDWPPHKMEGLLRRCRWQAPVPLLARHQARGPALGAGAGNPGTRSVEASIN